MIDLPLSIESARLRSWRIGDLDALVHEANSRAVWRNMTDTFPHPYERSDGRWWIERCLTQSQPRDLVIEVRGELAGGCGLVRGEGVAMHSAAIGYWLGERFWGHGIATAALHALLHYAWATVPVIRLQASVFGWNPASARVLEKNGFVKEGVLRSAVHKDGATTDELVYGLLRPESG